MPRVLILDDRVTNRNIYAKLAASVADGLSVHAYGNPLEALDWLDENEVDLVITDYKMPHIDGAEVTRRIRAKPHGVDVPIVVITVYDDRGFRLRALEAGATDFLLSPVDHHEFRTRARNLLALRQQQLLIRSHARLLARELEHSERSRERLLRGSREALAQVIDTVPAMISAADRDGRCIFVNARQAALVGATPADLVGRDVTELFGPERAARSRAGDSHVFGTGQPITGQEEEVLDGEGVRRVLLTTKAPLRDPEDQVVGVLTTSVDITDRKEAESRLRHLAHHDSVTDLPNRAFLGERLRALLSRSRRSDGRVALHFLDLDRFKAVNDIFGHQTGDGLLREVAKRLSGAVRAEDIVARLGGDEFAILQDGVRDAEDAGALAARVIEAVARPFPLEGREISVSASIGITLHPQDGTTADELLRNADLAMYRAKADGRNSYRFFDAAIDAKARAAMRLEADLRQALGRREFEVVYQPQACLRTGRIVAAEALLRWRRPEMGLIGPREFLAMAEETGLVAPIGAWVLQEACSRAASWGHAGLPPLRVASNLSPAQFRHQDVYGLVTETLERTGLDPKLLDLELTEGVFMENTEEVAETLRGLRQIGVRVSVDDFGTGYSSLSYLKSLPVDRLKIDQSFVRNLRADEADTAIVRTIIGLGHSLRLGVLAEGVETPEQVTELAAQGCDEIQGFYVGAPVPAEAFEDLVRRGWSLPHAA